MAAIQGEHWAAQSADYQLACLLGGAVGDALGAPLQFFCDADIKRHFGAAGLRDYAPIYSGRGAITDDTQLCLFTMEGLLQCRVARARGDQSLPLHYVHQAGLRWLCSQGLRRLPPVAERSFLLREKALFSRRAANDNFVNTLLQDERSESRAANYGKSGAGLCRVAPIALYIASDSRKFWGEAAQREAFDLGCRVCALSEGHPSGQLPGGVLCLFLLGLLYGHPPESCMAVARHYLSQAKDADETERHLSRAAALADTEPGSIRAIESLGDGRYAPELLAMALYCLFCSESFAEGVLLAVNHGGLSDSCGALAGQLLGAWLGVSAIPEHWLEALELRELMGCLAADFLRAPDEPLMQQRYANYAS
ncbi:ADP-ribosylglycohydrolase family protein [Spongiibacter sp.]|uniref:ADP-ribosylglycohydrolase family protein n=1 Tax=Spongiibacter sp. TaxID=2024860 RepID=UPI003564BE7D